jgi:hypothetical protein
MTKQMSLAALAATFLTAGAAVAYAESGAGIAGAGASVSSSATMENEWNQNASAGHGSSQSASVGRHSYGFAKERRLDHSNKEQIRQAGMNHKHS